MTMRLTRDAYQQLVDEDIAWLKTMPRTLERDHIIMILEHAVEYEYPTPPKKYFCPNGHPMGTFPSPSVDCDYECVGK